MDWFDHIAAIAGISLMALERFRPWALSDPNSVFALGFGLALVPALKSLRETLKR